MTANKQSASLRKILHDLREIAAKGPIPAESAADNEVGLALIRELGLTQSSAGKTKYEGIVVSARKSAPRAARNRINLFAKVPDWNLSPCKSSRDILINYGYVGDDGCRKLNCTVRANSPNSQGLFLEINRRKHWLLEKHAWKKNPVDVAVWKIRDLEDRLLERHPETMWVRAKKIHVGERDYFRYVEATYTGAPEVSSLSLLLQVGTITMDHLIQEEDKRMSEKGPLFKVDPTNLGLIFPNKKQFNLLNC